VLAALDLVDGGSSDVRIETVTLLLFYATAREPLIDVHSFFFSRFSNIAVCNDIDLMCVHIPFLLTLFFFYQVFNLHVDEVLVHRE
jgi:hypothetical protein